nr:transcription initiation factor IIF subunit alpha [Tanacetum cinerariifolium]
MAIGGQDLAISVSGCSRGCTDNNILLSNTTREGVCFHPCCYNFNKVSQYKQLTLEEAEEKIKNKKKPVNGYERWMMKAANNGATTFAEVERFDDKESVRARGRGRKKNNADDDESNVSD